MQRLKCRLRRCRRMQRLENGKRCNYRRPPRLHRTAILDNRLFLGGCGNLRTYVLGGVRGDRGSGGMVERKEKRMTGYKVFLSKEKKYIETVANILGVMSLMICPYNTENLSQMIGSRKFIMTKDIIIVQ